MAQRSLETQTVKKEPTESSVEPDVPKTPNNKRTSEYDERNLIINYVPANMSQEELQLLFSQVGPVDNAKLVLDKLTGQSLCYGFVKFKNAEDAKKAVEFFNGQFVGPKKLKVSVARPSSPQIKDANLYVSGFPRTFSVHEFCQMFMEFGEIITGRVLFDSLGRSRGVGFVRLDTHKNAERAIEALNGTKFPGFRERLNVKFANPNGSGSVHCNNSAVPSLNLAEWAYSSSYKSMYFAKVDPIGANEKEGGSAAANKKRPFGGVEDKFASQPPNRKKIHRMPACNVASCLNPSCIYGYPPAPGPLNPPRGVSHSPSSTLDSLNLSATSSHLATLYQLQQVQFLSVALQQEAVASNYGGYFVNYPGTNSILCPTQTTTEASLPLQLPYPFKSMPKMVNQHVFANVETPHLTPDFKQMPEVSRECEIPGDKSFKEIMSQSLTADAKYDNSAKLNDCKNESSECYVTTATAEVNFESAYQKQVQNLLALGNYMSASQWTAYCNLLSAQQLSAAQHLPFTGNVAMNVTPSITNTPFLTHDNLYRNPFMPYETNACYVGPNSQSPVSPLDINTSPNTMDFPVPQLAGGNSILAAGPVSPFQNPVQSNFPNNATRVKKDEFYVLVRNLPLNLPDKKMEELVHPISKNLLSYNRNNTHCKLLFSSLEDAINCVNALNGKVCSTNVLEASLLSPVTGL